MSRVSWIVVATVAVLVAIGTTTAILLSGDDGEATAPSAGAHPPEQTGGAPEDPRDVAAEEDAAVLRQLCAEFCEPLAAQAEVCPTGATDLMACRMPLAQGIDLVNDLADATAGLDRSDPERYEDFDAAIVDARDAYDVWSDNSDCGILYNTKDPALIELVGQDQVFICGANATTAGYTQATVGAILRNLERSA